MMWRRQDVAVMAKCLEDTLSLTGEDEAERIEGVGMFRYLGRLMERSDNDYPEVLKNIRKEIRLWGRLGELLWREGVESGQIRQSWRIFTAR